LPLTFTLGSTKKPILDTATDTIADLVKVERDVRNLSVYNMFCEVVQNTV